MTKPRPLVEYPIMISALFMRTLESREVQSKLVGLIYEFYSVLTNVIKPSPVRKM